MLGFLLYGVLAFVSIPQQGADLRKHNTYLARLLSSRETQITVPEGCCPGCGSKFQAEDADSPGFLQLDKLENLLGTSAGGAADPAVRRMNQSDLLTFFPLDTNKRFNPKIKKGKVRTT